MSEFEKVIPEHCSRLYRLCKFVLNNENREYILNRRFLGRINMEAAWMEETLDAAGARKNEKWFPFREGVSALKLFSSVTYDVIHVSRGYKTYKLLKKDDQFEVDISQVKDDLYNSIKKTADFLVKKAKSCGLHPEESEIIPYEFQDFTSIPHLECDRKLRHIENPGKSLIYLATEFINLKGELIIFSKLRTLKKSDYKNYIPDSVSEEKLRLVLVRFHNLQSLYDTYISESDIEDADKRLRVLRGHISFIYHMLKSATDFSHYYERHIVPRKNSLFYSSLKPIETDRFLDITIGFFMKYFSIYFNGAIELCRDVIDSYAEIDEIEVPVPIYRGFHVRPSTLVAKIVNYYGGRVRMLFNSMEYNPSTPLELFRLNEEINAIKRKKLFDIVFKEELYKKDLNSVLNDLTSEGVVIIYDENFKYIEFTGNNESYHEYLKGAFAYLLAAGKIDIRMEIFVKFIGDKRALNDIDILAKNGYGEDKYGKNIPLPRKLSYLKR